MLVLKGKHAPHSAAQRTPATSEQRPARQRAQCPPAERELCLHLQEPNVPVLHMLKAYTRLPASSRTQTTPALAQGSHARKAAHVSPIADTVCAQVCRHRALTTWVLCQAYALSGDSTADQLANKQYCITRYCTSTPSDRLAQAYIPYPGEVLSLSKNGTPESVPTMPACL